MSENEKNSDVLHLEADDFVLPFQLDSSGARGRLIRLGSVVNDILSRHRYPELVSKVLGEAITLTGMLGAALKFDGKFILQTQSDGTVSFMVVHYASPGQLRGYASHTLDHDDEAEEVEAAFDDAEDNAQGAPLGKGHLAMTIDPGAGMERYQGIVALAGETLVEAAHEYFAQSEQIPTFIRIAIAKHYVKANGSGQGNWVWRAGGLMVQKIAGEGGRPVGDEVLPPTISDEDDDGWRRALALAATVEDHELLDPTLAPDRLLYRLFHEENVRAFDALPLKAVCNCSRERVEDMLEQFSAEDLADMAKDDTIVVTCEFCNTHYSFDAKDYIGSHDASDEG